VWMIVRTMNSPRIASSRGTVRTRSDITNRRSALPTNACSVTHGNELASGYT
jgi:hypothetical protein